MLSLGSVIKKIYRVFKKEGVKVKGYYTARKWILGQAVANLRRKPKGAMAPLRGETANYKVAKLLLQGTKIIDFVFI